MNLLVLIRKICRIVFVTEFPPPPHLPCICRYVRVLGALYLRLVGETMECYNYLEPLYNDYRKLKRKNRNGGKELYPL